MRQLVAAYPNDHLGVNTITLDPLWRAPFGANGYLAASLPILLAIAGVVLLLTCANVATLALVRFVARRREIAIRQSLGRKPVRFHASDDSRRAPGFARRRSAGAGSHFVVGKNVCPLHPAQCQPHRAEWRR